MSIVKYESNGINLDARIEDGQAWLTAEQVATLFAVDVSTAREHAREILRSGECAESVQGKFPSTASDGKTYQFQHWNQDMVMHIGYRVRSERGSEFRRWATSVLKGEAAPLQPPKPLTQIQMLVLQAQAMAELEERQAETVRMVTDTVARVVHLEDYKRRADAEIETALALPPASVEVSGETDGQRTVTLLKAWAIAHGGAFPDAHRMLYQDVLARPETRIDLRARLENAKKTRARGEREKRLCDVIDETGKAAEVYAIAIKRFRDSRVA